MGAGPSGTPAALTSSSSLSAIGEFHSRVELRKLVAMLGLLALPSLSLVRSPSAPALARRAAALAPSSAAAAAVAHRHAVRMMCADRTVVATCTQKIEAALSPTKLEINGAYDDPNGSHISIYCVAEAFEGLRSMKRQQLVYKAIWEEMQGTAAPVHAVDSMVLKAPSEV